MNNIVQLNFEDGSKCDKLDLLINEVVGIPHEEHDVDGNQYGVHNAYYNEPPKFTTPFNEDLNKVIEEALVDYRQ